MLSNVKQLLRAETRVYDCKLNITIQEPKEVGLTVRAVYAKGKNGGVDC